TKVDTSAAGPIRGSSPGTAMTLNKCQRNALQITDLGELDVRSRIVGESFWVERIGALLGKYRSNPFTPDLFHRRQDPELVVDEHVVIGGIEALDVIKLQFFVDIDEDTVLERLAEAGSFHLARLEHGIAV